MSINGSILKIEPSFSENQYIMAFEKLMNGLNLSGLRGNNLTRKDFIKGSALYLIYDHLNVQMENIILLIQELFKFNLHLNQQH